MITITKRYKDFPAAHRQHNHDGHCAQVHGHNWSFELTFTSEKLDENGFVIDFGKLKFIKEWLTEMFDHTLLINEDDPEIPFFMGNNNGNGRQLWDVRVIPNGSAEDLAKLVFDETFDLLEQHGHADRVQLVSVTVYEDEKNCATYIQESSQ